MRQFILFYLLQVQKSSFIAVRNGIVNTSESKLLLTYYTYTLYLIYSLVYYMTDNENSQKLRHNYDHKTREIRDNLKITPGMFVTIENNF